MEYSNILMNSFLFLLLFFSSFFFCPDQPKQNWYWWPRLNIQDNNIWRWGKNDKTDNFYCSFMFCFQQWWGSHVIKSKRYCQYLIYPLFLKLPIALAYMLLQVSLNAWCTFTGTSQSWPVAYLYKITLNSGEWMQHINALHAFNKVMKSVIYVEICK